MYKSDIKECLSEGEIRRLITSTFGNQAQIKGWKELKGGTLNTVYDIEIFNPNLKTILKVSPDISRYPHISRLMTLETEVAVCPFVRSHMQIPAPEIYHSDFTRTQIDRNYFFMEKFSGTPLFQLQRKMPRESLQDIYRQLGSIASKLHNGKNDRFGHYFDLEDRSHEIWKDHFFHAFEETLGKIKKNGIALHRIIGISVEDLFHHLGDEAFLFEQVSEPSLIHGDLWNGNVFISFHKDKWSVEGIIDWEFSKWADPLFECPFYFNRNTRSFLEGYGEEGRSPFLLSGSERRRTIWYKLALFLIMLNEPVERGYRGLGAKLSDIWVRKNLIKTYAMLSLS